MRKLIVSNFATLDGFYETKDKTIDGLFEYYHEDYAGDQNFDYYNTERLRAANTLALSGRTSFLGNKGYWTGVPNDPNATAIRREFAELIQRVDKVVVSDKITWRNSRGMMERGVWLTGLKTTTASLGRSSHGNL